MRAESFYNFASYIEQVSDLRAYGGKSLHEQSHGESFISLFANRFEQGIYILDEPEAALSPQRQLSFLKIIHDLATPGHAQFLIALARHLVRTSAMRFLGGSPHLPFRNARIVLRSLAAVAMLGAAACGGGASAVPTSPGGSPGGTEILALDLSCPASLLIGEKAPCVAVARLRSGQTPVVSFDATWSSTRLDIVVVDAMGVVAGRAAGQTVVTASYRGRDATAQIVVTAEDALRIKAAADQGDFRPGSTVTMWLQGYYSVASAETGGLSLRIIDQTGTITTTSPVTVAKGGDFFLLSSTFIVPQNSTQVCRTAILEVASVTIAEPQSNASGLRCISIRR